MPLTLNCPKCKTPFKVRDEALGQKVKCPTCGAVLAVPSNIGPSSMTEIPIDPPVGRPSSYGAPPPVPPRPLTESGRIGSHEDPETFGFEEDPKDLERHLASPSMKNLGPRGRLESTRAMTNPPLATNRSRVPMPAPAPVDRRNQPVPVGEESEQFRGWRAVSRGLRLIQFGTWMLLLPVLCEAGKLAYFYFTKGNPEAGQGFLGLGKPLWWDIRVLYVAAPVVLGLFLILIGRIGLCRIPLSSEARGVASGAMLFELVVFLTAAAAGTLQALIWYGTIPNEGNLADANKAVPFAGLLFVLLSEVWYLLFLCQTGFPVGDPRMTRRVANFFLIVVFLSVVPPIVNLFEPVFGLGFGFVNFPFPSPEAQQMNMLLSWAGVVVGLFVVFFLYTRLAGKARRAIWKMIQDREPVMVMSR
jgi:predicted Zn finger-like uncharacterized protein